MLCVVYAYIVCVLSIYSIDCGYWLYVIRYTVTLGTYCMYWFASLNYYYIYYTNTYSVYYVNVDINR